MLISICLSIDFVLQQAFDEMRRPTIKRREKGISLALKLKVPTTPLLHLLQKRRALIDEHALLSNGAHTCARIIHVLLFSCKHCATSSGIDWPIPTVNNTITLSKYGRST